MTASDLIDRIQTQINLDATTPIRVMGTGMANDRIVTGPVDLSGRVFERPFHLDGLVFEDPVDLSDSDFRLALIIRRCIFRKGLRLAHTNVGVRCVLRGSRFYDEGPPWLDWRRLHVDGPLDLTTVRSAVGIDLSNLVCDDDLRLDGTRAGTVLHDTAMLNRWGSLSPSARAHLTDEMIGVAINLEGAQIRRDCYLFVHNKRQVAINGRLNLRSARLGGSVYVSRAKSPPVSMKRRSTWTRLTSAAPCSSKTRQPSPAASTCELRWPGRYHSTAQP